MTYKVYYPDACRSQGRDDDVSLNSATFNGGGGLGLDWVQDTDVNFRVRFLIQETAGRAAQNKLFALYYEKNGDGNPTGATAVTTASANVKLVDDTQSIADNATTTQVIGGGTYGVGESLGYSDGTTDAATGNCDFSGSDEIEVEFCIQIVGADVSDADQIQLYVLVSGGTQLNTYTDFPDIEVNKVVVAPAPSVTDNLTLS